MSWTDQQIQTLKEMWGHGFSASEIANRLGGGLSRNAIIGKAHRMKLSVDTPLATKQSSVARRTAASVDSMAAVVRASDRKRVMLRPLPVMPTAPSATIKRLADKDNFRATDGIKRTEGIAVTKAGERQCRWPVGDPRSPDFRFCGCQVYETLPYCIDHARVAYQNIGKKHRASESSAAAASHMSR